MTTYLFHGGTPGLKVGDKVLPPSETGVKSQTLAATLGLGLKRIAQRLDKVYITTDVSLARVYAGAWADPASSAKAKPGGGAVYRVEVEDGSLEDDEDLLSSPGISYQADFAVVVDIHHKTVARDEAEFAATIQRVLSAHKSNIETKSPPDEGSSAGSSFFRP